jgi:Fur family iron response transcriptional regulator
MRVSLATVYNTLHQFTDAGLLREIVVDSGRSYFDTNVANHHHMYIEAQKKLVDISEADIDIKAMPIVPDGMEVSRVDVIIRVK